MYVHKREQTFFFFFFANHVLTVSILDCYNASRRWHIPVEKYVKNVTHQMSALIITVEIKKINVAKSGQPLQDKQWDREILWGDISLWYFSLCTYYKTYSLLSYTGLSFYNTWLFPPLRNTCIVSPLRLLIQFGLLNQQHCCQVVMVSDYWVSWHPSESAADPMVPWHVPQQPQESGGYFWMHSCTQHKDIKYKVTHT